MIRINDYNETMRKAFGDDRIAVIEDSGDRFAVQLDGVKWYGSLDQRDNSIDSELRVSDPSGDYRLTPWIVAKFLGIPSADGSKSTAESALLAEISLVSAIIREIGGDTNKAQEARAFQRGYNMSYADSVRYKG